MRVKRRTERWENQSLLFGNSEVKKIVIFVFCFCNFKLRFIQNVLKAFIEFSQTIKF